MAGKECITQRCYKISLKVVGQQKVQKHVQQGLELCMLQVYAIHEDDEVKYPHVLPSFTLNDNPAVQTLLDQFCAIFEDHVSLPPSKPSFNHKVVLKEGSNPVNLRPYRYPLLQKDVIESMTKELLEHGDY